MIPKKPDDAEKIFVSVVHHTRSVALLKRSFVVVAILLVAALILWPILNPVEKHLKLSFTKMREGESGKPQMLHPKFQGVDNQGQPYEIIADTATQEGNNRVLLETITGRITLKDNGWIAVSSREGVVELDEGHADLKGMVHISSSDGYSMKTETMRVDIKNNTAMGNVPVEIEGPIGRLEATGFSVDNKTQIITFTGRVNTVIQPKQKKGD